MTAIRRKDPRVVAARTFLQIARDFTRPLDAIREAISNAIDAHASEIYIKAWEDKKMPGGELVLEISDNGDGMDERGLEAFFNLGDSTRVAEDGMRLEGFIGEKGHGTKTYFNCRQIQVFSTSKAGEHYYALMDEPLRHLLHMKVPPYNYDPSPSDTIPKGTKIVIRAFNQNTKLDFTHRILKDHIIWFTKFADFGWIFEDSRPKRREDSRSCRNGPILYLHGVGFDGQWEEIRYGHHFPLENTNLSQLRKKNSQPMRWYVKRWVKRALPVKEFPHVKLDIVFSLEGDLVRRDYNPMISYPGKKEKEDGDYTIERRYGLWSAREYIPVRQVSDWFSKGKSEWTKFHAFVNCSEFSLTANRADINNSEPKLLAKIEETVKDFYDNRIEDSTEFQEYKAAVREEEQYKNAQQEGKDFAHRKKRALKKHVAGYKGIQLFAPGPPRRGERGQEVGVHCLFAQFTALKPDLFPFKVVDYDTHKGYDCLVTRSTVFDLNNPNLAFVEFKYMLEPKFNHTFQNLAYIVCWDCDLNSSAEIVDLAGERRILDIFRRDNGHDYTRYFLRAIGKTHNIEVFVLKDYLKEKLKIEFKPVTADRA